MALFQCAQYDRKIVPTIDTRLFAIEFLHFASFSLFSTSGLRSQKYHKTYFYAFKILKNQIYLQSCTVFG